MLKKKKLLIYLCVALAVVAIGLGAFFGIRAYLKNRITFTV